MPEMLSRYLSVNEFRCRHCGKLPPDCVRDEGNNFPMFYEVLFNTFDSLRDLWQAPLIVSSGYRCPDHEQEVSGGRLGPHIFGAIDVALTSQEQPRFVDIVEANHPEVRMGTNTKPGATHVHFDLMQKLVPRYSMALIPGMRWIE